MAKKRNGTHTLATPGISVGRWLWRLVSAVAVLGGCAETPDSGELPPGVLPFGTEVEEPTHAVKVDALGAFLGAGYLFTKETHTGTQQERTEHLVQERVGVGATGSVYSPNFLLYELAGVVGPSQDWSRDRESSGFDTGELYEADVGLHVFPKRFHPMDLFFTRTEDLEPRVFFSKLEVTTMEARGTQRLKIPGGNVRLDVSRRETNQTVFGTDAPPFVDVAEDNIGVSGDYSLTDQQSIAAGYTFRNVRQSVSENSFTAHYLLASHRMFLDEADKNQLRSRIETNFQDGSLDQELVRWDETFTSQITDSLDADALFQLEENETNILDLGVLRGEAGVHHRWYESLDSSLRIRGERVIADAESTTDAIGGTAAASYRKNTAIGVLRLSYSISAERRFVENDRGGAIDEPHQFPIAPPEEVRLLQAGIDEGSIVITDPTGLIFYRRNIDYAVTRDPAGFVTITRIFAGTIPIGGNILVDYVFVIGADFTLDTITQVFRGEHEFHGGLAPYFSFRDQDQDASDVEGTGGVVPIRERSLIGGLEWRQPSFLLGAEYENRESTILPFDAVRLRAQGTVSFADSHHLTGNATQAWLFYEEPERDVSILQGNARWSSFLGRNLSFYVDTNVRYEDDSLQGNSFGISVGGGLEYIWREVIIRFRAAHRETRGVTSDFRGAEVGIWIVRTFGKPPPSVTAAVDRFVRQ